MSQPGYGDQQPGYGAYPQQQQTPGFAQQQSAYPPSYSQQTYPQQAYPQQVYPQQAYPQPNYPQQNPPQPAGQPQGYSEYPQAASATSLDMEQEDAAFDFSDKSIRRSFIRKVYAILSLQLALTAAIIGIFYIPEVRKWNEDNPGLAIGSCIATLVLVIALACVPNLRRKAPANIIVLIIFTAFEGIVLGSVCAYYSADEVLMAVVTTIVIFVGLTLFAFQTKIDFTVLAGAMFSILWALIMFGFMCLLFPSDVMYNLYAALGAIIFSLYIIVDTQLLIGGKHKISISPEEYIFAALNLYLDIVNLFLFLLRLFGDN